MADQDSRPLRIAIIAVERKGSAPSGAHRYAGNVIEALSSRRDLDVLAVVNPEDRALTSGFGSLEQRAPGVTIVHKRISPTTPVPLVLWYALGMPALKRRLRADVIHVLNARPTFFASTVQTLHDVAELRVDAKYSFLRSQYRRKVLYRLLRRAPVIVTVSESAKRDIALSLGLAPDRVLVIPNIDNGLAVTPTYVPDVPYFLAVGRVDHPSKNLLLLIQAFETIAAAHPTCELTLVGADSFNAEVIHQRAASSPFRDRIHLRGFVNDAELPSLYAGAVALCFPSQHEGFGLPALEAVNRGLPVLFSAGGALREVVGTAHGELPTHDPKAWSSAMLELLDPDRRASLLAAQTFARTPYGREEMAEELATLYRRLLER